MKFILATIAFVGLSAQLAVPAAALNARTWVSGTGVDQAGCGPISNPCRTLQYAHDQTSEEGEINFKDSAGYGSVVINKSIKIVAEGVMAGVLGAPGGTAVTLNTDSYDKVLLRGLAIEGGGQAFVGVTMPTGGVLYVDRCSIQGFTYGVRVDLQANKYSNVSINNSDVYSNSTGFYSKAPLLEQRVTIWNSRFIYNGRGIDLLGPTPSRYSVTNTVVEGGSTGIYVGGGNALIDGVTVRNMGTSGIVAGGGITLIGRSGVLGNDIGVSVGQNVIAYSYRNNQINGNRIDVSGSLQTATFQ